MVAECGMCGVEIEEGKETYIPIDEGTERTLNTHL